jgi:ring-1,2-phenylacetyl-CoA epoxidase subunit PaaC
VVRNFLFSAFQRQLWQALQSSADTDLAAIAAKSLKEARYHERHSGEWMIRLGDGTPESHTRAQAALERLWPYTAELFSQDAIDETASQEGVGPAWASLQPAWSDVVTPVIEEATLRLPPASPFRSRGKLGVHSEHMGHLLSEMQYLQRAYPGATW